MENRWINIGFNCDNLILDQGFDKWIESIRDELNKLLSDTEVNVDHNLIDSTVKEFTIGEPYTTIVYRNSKAIRNTKWYTIKGPYGLSVEFCEYEFDAHSQEDQRKWYPKNLHSLVTMRVNSMLFDLEMIREGYLLFLKRLDPNYKTPDQFIH